MRAETIIGGAGRRTTITSTCSSPMPVTKIAVRGTLLLFSRARSSCFIASRMRRSPTPGDPRDDHGSVGRAKSPAAEWPHLRRHDGRFCPRCQPPTSHLESADGVGNAPAKVVRTGEYGLGALPTLRTVFDRTSRR